MARTRPQGAAGGPAAADHPDPRPAAGPGDELPAGAGHARVPCAAGRSSAGGSIASRDADRGLRPAGRHAGAALQARATRGDVRDWLTAYAKAGGPHHNAVCFGDATAADSGCRRTAGRRLLRGLSHVPGTRLGHDQRQGPRRGPRRPGGGRAAPPPVGGTVRPTAASSRTSSRSGAPPARPCARPQVPMDAAAIRSGRACPARAGPCSCSTARTGRSGRVISWLDGRGRPFDGQLVAGSRRGVLRRARRLPHLPDDPRADPSPAAAVAGDAGEDRGNRLRGRRDRRPAVRPAGPRRHVALDRHALQSVAWAGPTPSCSSGWGSAKTSCRTSLAADEPAGRCGRTPRRQPACRRGFPSRRPSTISMRPRWGGLGPRRRRVARAPARPGRCRQQHRLDAPVTAPGDSSASIPCPAFTARCSPWSTAARRSSGR